MGGGLINVRVCVFVCGVQTNHCMCVMCRFFSVCGLTNVCVFGVQAYKSVIVVQVRAREAAKQAKEMTRSTKVNKQLEMLSRLPEMARIIRNTFVTEKKAALTWEMVVAKIVASNSSMIGSRESHTPQAS